MVSVSVLDPICSQAPLKTNCDSHVFLSQMTFKRRNQGRAKHNRGHTKAIRCSGCGRCTPKDKSICRFQVKNIVESAAQRDIRDACAYESEYFLATTLTV